MKFKVLLKQPEISFDDTKSPKSQIAIKFLKEGFVEDNFTWSLLLGWLVTHAVGKLVSKTGYEEQSSIWLEEWLLLNRFIDLLRQMSTADTETQEAGMLLNILVREQNWFLHPKFKKGKEYKILDRLLKLSDVQKFLKVNRWDSVLWFNKENFQKLVWWLFLISVIQIGSKSKTDQDAVRETEAAFAIIQRWLQAEKKSEYQLKKLVNELKK